MCKCSVIRYLIVKMIVCEGKEISDYWQCSVWAGWRRPYCFEASIKVCVAAMKTDDIMAHDIVKFSWDWYSGLYARWCFTRRWIQIHICRNCNNIAEKKCYQGKIYKWEKAKRLLNYHSTKWWYIKYGDLFDLKVQIYNEALCCKWRHPLDKWTIRGVTICR